MDTQLVRRGDLDTVVGGLMLNEQGIVDDIEKVLPMIRVDSIKKGLMIKLEASRAHLLALQQGFVPIDHGWFIDVKSKGRWAKKEVEEVVRTMPDEVKEIWKRLEDMGIFRTFAVSRRGVDPMLVGKAGRKNFLIAAWINIEGGVSVGIISKGAMVR